MTADPFDIGTWGDTTAARLALRAAAPLVERLLDLRELRRLYADARSRQDTTFVHAALDALRVSAACPAPDLAQVPAAGPAVVVANHPHGALDGLVLASVIGHVRQDVRLLANRALAHIPELHDLCFFVDPFDGPAAAARSRAGLRAAHLWLRQGHVLVAFPAGEVAHRLGSRTTPYEAAWHDTAIALAARTGASVVPAFIEGRNSRRFYALGRLHPLVRTVLLPAELTAAAGRTVPVRIGAALCVPDPVDAAGVTRTARRRAEELGSDAAALRMEIAGLDHAALLLESGPYAVFCARGREVPAVMREIGRQRARAYRAAGEGTGTSSDFDAFDDDYTQLFAWDRPTERVVGAYRLTDVAEATRTAGVKGLYTRQLFDYDRRFLDALGPAVELGRSWVMPEYQKHSSVLFLLWRAVGTYLAERTDARVLLGAVTISPTYSEAAGSFLRTFLLRHHAATNLAGLVAPLRPPLDSTGEPATPATVEGADALVRRLEPDGKRMPVLLRHYLKLNARVVAFSIDPAFGNAVDALMTVDLATLDPSLLARYFGADAAARFVARATGPARSQAA